MIVKLEEKMDGWMKNEIFVNLTLELGAWSIILGNIRELSTNKKKEEK